MPDRPDALDRRPIESKTNDLLLAHFGFGPPEGPGVPAVAPAGTGAVDGAMPGGDGVAGAGGGFPGERAITPEDPEWSDHVRAMVDRVTERARPTRRERFRLAVMEWLDARLPGACRAELVDWALTPERPLYDVPLRSADLCHLASGCPCWCGKNAGVAAAPEGDAHPRVEFPAVGSGVAS